MNMTRTLLAASVALGLSLAATAADACSRLIWNTDDHGVFVTRTMDWLSATDSDLEVRAKGQTYRGAEQGENVVTWTSKYASIMSTFFGRAGIDGFNEKGLSANGLYLQEEDVGQYDASKSQLENSRLVPYFLDNFGTVKEALAGLDNVQLQQIEFNGVPLTGHYSLQDASGDSAIIEVIKGEIKIYHGPQYDVMTNSPEYFKHLENWKAAQPKEQSDVNAEFPIPGNIKADQRFIWNKYMLSQLLQPSSYTNGTAKLNSATYKIPLDAANRVLNGKMTTYATEYTLVYNLDQQRMNVRYQYGDTFTQYYVDLAKLNDGKNYVLNTEDPLNFGDVSTRFIEQDGIMGQYRIK